MSIPLPAHDPRHVDDPDGAVLAAWEQGLRWRTLPAAMGRALAFTFRSAPRTAALAMALAVLGAGVYAALYGLLPRLVDAAARVTSVAAALPLLPLVCVGVALLATRAGCGAAAGYVDWRLHNEVFGHADLAMLRAAARVPLERYEDATFHALLQRCANSVGQVCAAAPKIVQVLGDLASALAIALALSITNGWLIPVAGAAALPALITELWAARQWYRVQVRIAWPSRLRYYLGNRARGRAAAAEIRALDLGGTFESWSRTAFRNMARPQRLAQRNHSLWFLFANCVSGLILVVGAAVSLGVSGGGWAGLLTTVVGLAQLRSLFSGMFGTLSEVADAALYLRDLEELESISRSVPAAIGAGSGPAPHLRPVTAPPPREVTAPPLGEAAAPPLRDVTVLREVTVHRLGYRYPGAEQPALTELSLAVRAGELIAVVGRNGSGKTTLAKLLAGLLPATEGTARWNGDDYARVPDVVRRGVTMQFQEPTRWCFTVRENVWLGDAASTGTDRRIWSALERAQLADVVRALPDGLDTRLGKELGPGADLSGGQWQRLALARCFFRDSELVILDEPTSAFDAIAEAAFLGSIRELLAGRAGVLITHRFAHLALADMIYVLDGGRLVQRGTHDELLAQDGIYAQLYRTQLENLLDTRPS